MTSSPDDALPRDEDDAAPGDSQVAKGITSYLTGLGLAVLLTVCSFWLAGTDFIYGPGLPVALAVLAIAQIGIHLVFFLHLTTAPDNTNNVMALAFGVFIVFLVVGGSVWIMDHLNGNMMPMEHGMGM
ncbi:cytochrome o ubiquinol oxidase subunit IV [Paracraurococcus lichenis]|uniref:Cytochrome bo(3) ubiquinol oxidase subunit 4 n=1 Tax=Paracraurococcus lichenis TaxID=3064888 RepID=A0ABT9DYQ1_9PROT|nr:cytochrome o ubiquinol oxidase subunit IV [Paracraurococcus sp. LOR1-02]MDO9709019.1 cytochrome o ubiquinol oxidase subunit IV [Paracraurococcus sp. LOR1-02]